MICFGLLLQRSAKSCRRRSGIDSGKPKVASRDLQGASVIMLPPAIRSWRACGLLPRRRTAGTFFQRRFSGAIVASQRQLGAEPFWIDIELRQCRDAKQRHGMRRIENAQHRHRVAQLGRIEQVGAFDPNGNAARGEARPQSSRDDSGCDTAPPIWLSQVPGRSRRIAWIVSAMKVGFLLQAVAERWPARLARMRTSSIAHQARAAKRLPRPASVGSLDAEDFRIALDRLIRAAQDRQRGATVGRHGHALHAIGAEGVQKLIEGAAGGSAKLVDGLVGIADGENVRFLSRQQAGELDLRDVGILKLVDQDEACPPLRALQNRLTAR